MVFGIDDAVGAVTTVIGKVVDRVWPDPTVNAQIKADLAKAQIDATVKQALAETGLIQGQLDINKAEAANANVFVAGWRPAVGWVGAFALANKFIIAPYFTWIAALFHSTAAVPPTDITELVALIAGMLGFGYMRTTEKMAGKAGGGAQ